MFHNCFDGTLPKIQTFLTGQGVQGTRHCSPVLAELLPAMLDIYPPKNPAGSGAACAVDSPSCQQDRANTKIFLSPVSEKLVLPSPTAPVWTPYNKWAFAVDLDGGPRPHCAPQNHPRPPPSPPELRGLSSAIPPGSGRGRGGQG